MFIEAIVPGRAIVITVTFSNFARSYLRPVATKGGDRGKLDMRQHFGPDAIALMDIAFAKSITRLSPADTTVDDHVRDAVAKAIVSLASQELDEEMLMEHGTAIGRNTLQLTRFLPCGGSD